MWRCLSNLRFDVVLIIRKEIEATRSGTLSVIEPPESLPPALRRPREIASEELERRNGEMAESLADLKSKYVDALRGMKKAYTKAGKIELAIAIASEIEAYGAEGDLAENGAPRTLAQLPEDLQSGLTAWFPLDEDGVVEVKDLAKRGMVGQLSGTLYTPDGVIGGARKFRGQGDRIALGHEIPDSPRFSVSVWVKYTGMAGKGGIFSDYDNKFANDVMLALVSAQEVHLRADKGGDKLRTEAILSEPLTQGWHHLVWIVDSRETVLYLDGEEAVRHEGEGSNRGFHGAYLGFANDGKTWSYFEGEIDEFMMWERALNEEEIVAIRQLSGP